MPMQDGQYLSRFIIKNDAGKFLTCNGWHAKEDATIYEEEELTIINYPREAVAICWLNDEDEIVVESRIFHG